MLEHSFKVSTAETYLKVEELGRYGQSRLGIHVPRSFWLRTWCIDSAPGQPYDDHHCPILYITHLDVRDTTHDSSEEEADSDNDAVANTDGKGLN